MDSQDQKAAVVSKVLRKYRKVVRIMRLVPFMYLCLFAVVSLTSNILPERLSCIIDCTMFVSPVVSAGTILLSGVLGMCRWHKVACILPYSSRLVSFVDTNFVTFTQNELVAINCIIGIAMVSFIALAFKHFFLQDARLQARS